MTLNTSLVVSGDSASGQAALRATEAALGSAEKEARQLAKAFGDVDVSASRLAAAQTQAKAATDAAKASLAAGEISLEQYNRQLIDTKTQLGLVSSAHNEAVAGLKKSQAAFNDAVDGLDRTQKSTGQARMGYMMLGQQAQDVAVMLQGGANIGTIIATQGGQVATAVQMMGGKMSGFAGFMAGPWGAAITVGIGVLVNLMMAMDDTADAAAAATAGADALGQAQSSLANLFSGANSRIAEQNELLILNARLMAINLRADAMAKRASSDSVFGGAGGIKTHLAIAGVVGGAGESPNNPVNRNSQAVQALIGGMRSGSITRDAALKATEGLNYSGLKITRQQLQQAIIDSAVADLSGKTADLIEQSIDRGGLVPALQKQNGRKPRKGGGKAANPAVLEEFTEDTAKKIRAIRDEYSDIPAAIQQSNRAMAELDDLASDINRKKLLPQVREQLLGDLADAKRAVEDGLNKPFRDFMDAQRESAAIDRLLIQGRDDEAEALKVVLALQKQQGPLTLEQLDAVLATVQAQRQYGMVLRDQRALIQANIDAVHDMRGALEQTVGQMLRGKFSFDAILTSLGNSFIQIASKQIVEAMFGDTLRALEDQASGANRVDAAGKDMAIAMGKGSSAVLDFARAVTEAGGKIAPSSGESRVYYGSEGKLGDVAATVTDSDWQQFLDRFDQEFPITVVAPKAEKTIDSGSVNIVVDMAQALLNKLGAPTGLTKVLADVVKGSLGRLEGSLPQMMKGAVIGSTGASLILGDRGNNAGSMIGGAFGESLFKSVAPKLFSSLGSFAGPLGSLAFGLVGGLIGKLLGGSKWGTSVVGSGKASGNSDQMKSGSVSAGNSIQSAIERIAEQFNASVGSYQVSIGQMDGKWRVSTTGRSGKLENKYKDVTNFGKDGGQAAFSYALSDAIADGAIQGVSAAVQKALRSSQDIDKAIKEATKVQEVELMVGGLTAQISKAFKDFERQAAERVRIAREYGFDVVKIEERNAEDRLKLTKDLLAQQVGSLQDLIDEMTSGSLFEGSVVEQRQLLLDQVAAAKAAADAGEEGAADKLAALLEQINTVSKEAFGTTGAFAADRSMILDAARDTIAKANQRITDAQASSDPAVVSALDENNDQNAQLIALLGITNEQLGVIAARARGDFTALSNLALTGAA